MYRSPSPPPQITFNRSATPPHGIINAPQYTNYQTSTNANTYLSSLPLTQTQNYTYQQGAIGVQGGLQPSFQQSQVFGGNSIVREKKVPVTEYVPVTNYVSVYEVEPQPVVVQQPVVYQQQPIVYQAQPAPPQVIERVVEVPYPVYVQPQQQQQQIKVEKKLTTAAPAPPPPPI